MVLKNIDLVASLIDDRKELLRFKEAVSDYSNTSIEVNGYELKGNDAFVRILSDAINDKILELIKGIDDELILL
jgi:uncharacterized protein YaaR (DUF327 family)